LSQTHKKTERINEKRPMTSPVIECGKGLRKEVIGKK
jgi:hypothetical protein